MACDDLAALVRLFIVENVYINRPSTTRPRQTCSPNLKQLNQDDVRAGELLILEDWEARLSKHQLKKPNTAHLLFFIFSHVWWPGMEEDE
jgi:hypothetical protein